MEGATAAVALSAVAAAYVSLRRNGDANGHREYRGTALAYPLLAGALLGFLGAREDPALAPYLVLVGGGALVGAVAALWRFIAELSPSHGRFLPLVRNHAVATWLLMSGAFALYPIILRGPGGPEWDRLLFGATSGCFLVGYAGWAAVIFFRCGKEVFLPTNALRSYALAGGFAAVAAASVGQFTVLALRGPGWAGGPVMWLNLGGVFLLATGVLLPMAWERHLNAFLERVYWARYAYEDIHNVLAAINDRLPLILPRRDALAMELTRGLCDLLDLPPGERNQTLEAAAITTFQASVLTEELDSSGGRDAELNWEYLSPAAALRSDVYFYARVGRILSQVDHLYGGGDGHTLRGEALPRGSRILRVVRYYVEHREDPRVLEQLVRGKGRDFDPRVVDGLQELLGVREAPAQAGNPERAQRLYS